MTGSFENRLALAQKCAEAAEQMSQTGRLPEALRILDRSLKKIGPMPGLYAARARANFHYRHYDDSFRDFKRAIDLSPRDPQLYAQRSDLLAQLNRTVKARADLRRAVALNPTDPWLRYAQLRLLIFCNQKTAASREIARLMRDGTPGEVLEARFYRGCLRLKAGLGQEAQKDFQFVISSTDAQDNRNLRAHLYSLLAKLKYPDFQKKYFPLKQAKGPKLYLCGMGLFPPYTATLDVLNAIGRCDSLINNVSGVETREFLSVLCPDVRPATYDNHGDDEFWVRRIVKELRLGRTVAFVTRGHPLVFGGLGEALVRRCESLQIECETFGAVSSIDILSSAMSLLAEVPARGVQAYDHKVVVLNAEPIDPRHPLLLYICEGLIRGKEVYRVKKTLRRFYPEGHECWMFGPTYDAAPEAFPLGQMPSRFPEIHPSQIIYIPALNAGRSRE